MNNFLAAEKHCKRCNRANPSGLDFCIHCSEALPRETPSQVAQDEYLIGKLIDRRFRVLDRIGVGGMATIYRAEQVSVGRQVALKVMHRHLANNRLLRQRFRSEATLASRLNHPNLISIYDFGETQKRDAYIAMELVEGVTLGDEIKKFEQISWRRVCRLGVQICNALHEAHENSIVHRDLKPDNIMLTYRGPGADTIQFIKVLDFGLAMTIGNAQRDQRGNLQQSDELIGTPEYMSPEQIEGLELDHRTDIYSLGIVLYRMLTGEHPFTVRTPIMIMNHHLSERPRYFGELGKKLKAIPSNLEALVMSMLRKDRESRPRTMYEVAAKLDLLQKDRSRGFAGFTPSRGIDMAKLGKLPQAPGAQRPPLPAVLAEDTPLISEKKGELSGDDTAEIPGQKLDLTRSR